MSRARKEYRRLTVSRTRDYATESAPALRIQGKWLRELGFAIGDPVIVKCEDERLIITLDRERAELLAEEKARVEAE